MIFWKQSLYLHEVGVRSAYTLPSPDPTCRISVILHNTSANGSPILLSHAPFCLELDKHRPILAPSDLLGETFWNRSLGIVSSLTIDFSHLFCQWMPHFAVCPYLS